MSMARRADEDRLGAPYVYDKKNSAFPLTPQATF